MLREFSHEMLTGILSIVLVTSGMALGLRFTKDIPSLIQTKAITLYPTVEAAEADLGLPIALPSYFPERLAWPPAEIKVIRAESITVSLVFALRKETTPGLVIYHVFGSKRNPDLPFQEPRNPDREKEVFVGKIKGEFLSGIVPDGKRWSRVSWQDENHGRIVMSALPEKDLLAIAGSLH